MTEEMQKAVRYNHRMTSGQRVNRNATECENYLQGYIQATQEMDKQDGRRIRTRVEIEQMIQKEYEKDNRKKPTIHRERTYQDNYGISKTPMTDLRGHKLRACTRLAELLDKATTYEERTKTSHENNHGRC